MPKRIAITMVIAAVAGMVGHAWRSDALPGDPGILTTDPQQQGTALAPTAAVGAASSCDDTAAPGVADVCLLDAALATTEEARTLALRRAARASRREDAASADALFLMAAGRGDLQALADYAGVDEAAAENGLLRREAALMAAQGGSAEAQNQLDRQRGAYRAQALSRPEVLASLLEGRGLELFDDMDMRRYLLGLNTGVQQSCPFQAAMWESAGFARAHEMYAAPVVARSHMQVASSAVDALSQVAGAVSQFAQRMEQGASYAIAGASLLRELRDAQRKYNTAVSRASEAGARDGVRIAELLAGCSSVDGVRLTRALMDVFSARARQVPAQG